MSDISPVFKDLFAKFENHNRRIKKFETWEPATYTSWIGDVGAHAYRTSNVALSVGVWADVAFNGELWDTGSINSSGVFTIPQDGKYLLVASLAFTTFTGIIQIRIEETAATATIVGGNNGSATYCTASGIMDLNAGNTVKLQAVVAAASNLLGSANTYLSFFQIQRVA